MIRAGEAELVTSAADVRELAGRVGELAGEPEGADDPLELLREFPPSVAQVYEALGARGSRTPSELSESSGVAPATVRAALSRLELCGLARRTELGWARNRHARVGA